MVRNAVPAGRRRGFGALLGAGGLGVLVVATAAACASTPTTAGAGGTGSAPVVVSSSAAAAPSASPSQSTAPVTPSAPGAGGTAGGPSSSKPAIPSAGGIIINPRAQVTAIPAGGKLTAFDSAAHSQDGRTLYLGLESMGGACGQYEVVLQQNSAKVSVGLVLLPSGGKVCPMYVAHMLVAAKLSAPLGDRSVVDLANGQVVRTPELS
jgi:hypothetical protein